MGSDMTLAVILNAIDNASATVAAVGDQVDATAGRMGRMGQQAASAGKGLMAAGGAVTGALTAAAYSAAAYADNIEEMAQRTGLSSEQLQFLDYAASLSGSSLEAVAGGVARLQRGMVGSPQKFAELGIAVHDSAGKMRNAYDVMGDVAELIRNAPDDATRTAIAMQAFGRGGAQLLPLLANGREGLQQLKDGFQAVGGAMPTAAAAEFQDQLDQAKSGSLMLVRAIGAALIPTLSDLTGRVVAWVGHAREWVAHNQGLIRTAFELGKWLLVVGGTLYAVGKAAMWVNAVTQAVAVAKGLWTAATAAQTAAEGGLATASATAGAVSFAAMLPVIAVVGALVLAVMAVAFAWKEAKRTAQEYRELHAAQARADVTDSMYRFASEWKRTHGTTKGWREAWERTDEAKKLLAEADRQEGVASKGRANAAKDGGIEGLLAQAKAAQQEAERMQAGVTAGAAALPGQAASSRGPVAVAGLAADSASGVGLPGASAPVGPMLSISPGTVLEVGGSLLESIDGHLLAIRQSLSGGLQQQMSQGVEAIATQAWAGG